MQQCRAPLLATLCSVPLSRRLGHNLVTLPLPLSVTQRLAPSKATPSGLEPAEKVPRLTPSEARSSVTVLLFWFTTQMSAPSKATPRGRLPTAKVPRLTPSEARSSVTVLPLSFATQMSAPSKATPNAMPPTENVPRFAPSEARSLVTVPLPSLVTQMSAPSKATPSGVEPTEKEAARLAPNHLSNAIRWRFGACACVGDWQATVPSPFTSRMASPFEQAPVTRACASEVSAVKVVPERVSPLPAE